MAEVRALQCRGFLWNYSYPVVRLGVPVIGVGHPVKASPKTTHYWQVVVISFNMVEPLIRARRTKILTYLTFGFGSPGAPKFCVVWRG